MGTSLKAELLLSIAVTVTSEQRVESVLQKTVQGLAAQKGVALTRIWLLPSIHLPSSWRQPAETTDVEHLHLVASAGTPINSPGENWSFLQGHFARVPMHVGKVGQVAAERHPILIKDIALENSWIVRPEWAKREAIRSFAGYPLIFRDNLLGVIAVFSRESLEDQEFAWLGLFANHAAVAIANTRAFEDLSKVEEALRSSESNLSRTINTIPTFIQVSRPDGTVLSVNQAVLDYHGIIQQDVQKEDFRSRFYHPDDLPSLMEKWMRMLTSGESDEIEARLRRHDGVYRWFLIRAQPFRDESGKIVRWYGTSTDIDDRKKAEEALQASERKLTVMINVIPALIHTARPDGYLDYFNSRWLEYLGCSLVDVEGWKWTTWIHPDDLIGIVDKWKACLASGEIFEYETRVRRGDGEYRWMFHRKVPLRDEHGNILQWYGTSIDIEDRKRAEAQVEQAYVRLAEAQRLSKTGSFITDLLADEHNWSDELYRIFELDPATRITHEVIRTVFHPEDLPIYEAAFKRAVDGLDQDLELAYRIITPAGNLKHVHSITHVMGTAAGRPVFIGAIQDVTESKVAEQSLTRARSELAHMARVTTLSALTASIAHEINQPISAAVSSAGACLRWLNREQPEVQRAREAAMRIEEDGKRAAEIITHLKSFYKKDVSPQRETVSINDVVGEMLVLLRSEADRHSVVMRTDLEANLPSVSTDRVLLQQVLMNLMQNGMEAMNEPGGELKISTRREDEEVIVSVSDTGVGIPADKMEEIFNAFVTTKAGGTGMGLAISSTIIESQGGRVWATENPARGATFHFTLPNEPRRISDH